MDAGREQRNRDVDFDRDASAAPRAKRRPRWWGTASLNLATRQPVAHAIMFYLLAGMALLIFAPCVIVPIWQDVRRLSDDERALAALVGKLQDQIDKNKLRIDALTNDPLVIERVARRELNRRFEDEQKLRWSAAELAALRVNIPHDLYEKPELPAASVPPWAVSIRKWLPAWSWPELFAKSPNREFLLVMAGCLLLTAFVLYTPRAECRVREES